MFKHWFISVRVKKSNLVPFYEKGDKIFFEKLSSGFTFYQYVAKKSFGKKVSWTEVNVGGLQGSVDPLLFLIDINDSPDFLSSNVQHFL